MSALVGKFSIRADNRFESYDGLKFEAVQLHQVLVLDRDCARSWIRI